MSRNFQRILFIVIGGLVVIQSAINKEWWGVILGGCFVTAGIFQLGCLAGNCNASNDDKKIQSDDTSEIIYEEIK